MRMHPFHRTELLVGGQDWLRLGAANVCVVGLGGVGSYAAEAIVRAGVGHVTLVDFDSVCVTNVNRQLPAMRSTVGERKAELMGARARDINPKANIRVMNTFYSPITADEVLDRPYDFVIDAIDNMTAKVHLLSQCVARGIPVMASMGAGGRMDPTRIRVSDISETHTDPFARIVRDLLRQMGITEGVECVWTDESPLALDPVAESGFRCICVNKVEKDDFHGCEGRQVQGTVSWMPSIFGLTAAGVVVNRLLDRPIASDEVSHNDFLRMSPSQGKPSRSRKKELLASVGLGRPERDPGAP